MYNYYVARHLIVHTPHHQDAVCLVLPVKVLRQFFQEQWVLEYPLHWLDQLGAEGEGVTHL